MQTLEARSALRTFNRVLLAWCLRGHRSEFLSTSFIWRLQRREHCCGCPPGISCTHRWRHANRHPHLLQILIDSLLDLIIELGSRFFAAGEGLPAIPEFILELLGVDFAPLLVKEPFFEFAILVVRLESFFFRVWEASSCL